MKKGKKYQNQKVMVLQLINGFNMLHLKALSLYMYQNPKRAKKLYNEIVPKAVDEYLDSIEKAKIKKNYNY
jgi:lysyl-tRNA synthetase class 1